MAALDKDWLDALVGDFTDGSEWNRVRADIALNPDVAGLRMYERPLVGVASADDPMFETLRLPHVVGPHFRPPRAWLPEAASVVSLFLPFTPPVIETNRRHTVEPSPEWLHARIEGQDFINRLSRYAADVLSEAGYPSLAPSLSPDFRSFGKRATMGDDGAAIPPFTSNWSERHVAHAAGLGTFSLAAGLITAKGTAGRFASVVTALALPADPRPYARHDEYCSRCGICARRCVHGALSLESGKDKAVCAAFVDTTRIAHSPRYGCGKCHVAVPCERRMPGR